MIISIFRHEFKSRLRSVLIWSAAAVTLLFVYAAIFPSFSENAALLNETMASFPEGFRAAFGLDEQDLSTVLGYFSFVYLFLQIILSIQAANYGVGLVSVEERDLTADFLLTRPVTRPQIITSKLLAALASLGLTQIIVWMSAFFFLNLFRAGKTFDARVLAIMLSGLIGFQLFFLGVGLLISLLLKRVRSVTPVSLALALGMYAVSGFSEMQGDSVLENITPFKHFDPIYALNHHGFDATLVSISLTITLVSVIASYWLYTRRDIHAVS